MIKDKKRLEGMGKGIFQRWDPVRKIWAENKVIANNNL